MNKYIKLLFSFAAVCLLFAFSGAAAHASDLPSLEDDPLAYYYNRFKNAKVRNGISGRVNMDAWYDTSQIALPSGDCSYGQHRI